MASQKYNKEKLISLMIMIMIIASHKTKNQLEETRLLCDSYIQ